MAAAAQRHSGAPSGEPDGATPAAAPESAYPAADPRRANQANADAAVPPGSPGTGTPDGPADPEKEAAPVPRAPDSKRLEITCAAIAVVATGALILMARAIEVRSETGGIDPRWWPEMLGTAGLVLAVALLVVSVVRRPFSREDLDAATREGWVRTVIAVALAVGYVLVWPVVGFLLATPLFLIAATYVFGGRGWKTLLLFPILTTAFIHLLFRTLLEVPL